MITSKIYSFAVAALIASTGFSHGAFTLQIRADNDFTIFAGTSTNATRIVYQNNNSHPTQIAGATGSFDLQGDETTFYIIALGAGGQENIGGRVNGKDITSFGVSGVNAQKSTNVGAFITNFNTISPLDGGADTIDSGTFVVTLADMQTALANTTFTNATAGDVVTTGVGTDNAGGGNPSTGTAFNFTSNTAVIYKFSASSVGVAAIPEPAVSMLGLVAGFAFLGRRKR